MESSEVDGLSGVQMAQGLRADRARRSIVSLLALGTLVTLASGCSDEGMLHVVSPLMVLEPPAGTPLTYAEVVLTRTEDDPQIIEVLNKGGGLLSLDRVLITGRDANQFTVTSYPKVVQPGAKGEIFVRFLPTMRIQAEATLHIEDNDPRQRVAEYPLAGPARDPCHITVAPTYLSFLLGEMKTVSLSADGTQDCTITYLFTDGDLFPFINPPTVPFTIPAGTSMTLTVQHVSTSLEPGIPVRQFNARESEGTEVDASFSGQAPLFNCLTVFPYQIEFDTVPLGGMAQQPVTVTNTCIRDAYVTAGVTTIGAYYYTADHAQFPLKVPAMGSAPVMVTYVPFSPGGDDGKIILYTNDAGAPQLPIKLRGRAAVPGVAIFPTILDFGNVAYKNPSGSDHRSQCSSSAEYIQVYSDGEAPLTINSLSFTGDADFQIVDVLVDGHSVSSFNQPFTVPPSKDAKILIQFYPTRLSPADHQSQLIIDHNAAGSPFTVTLKGHAVPDGATTDTFQQLSGPKVDILWVVDDSCSMFSKQALLINNLSQFIGYADSQNADYNVAVVDTEGFSPAAGRFERAQCYPFPRVVSSHWADSATRQAAFHCMFSLGTTGSGIEAGLAAAKAGLIKSSDPTMDPDGYNQGFLRPDARLAIVTVSDEDDQSREAAPLQRDYFLSIKGPHRKDFVRVHAIAGPVDQPCQAGATQALPGYNYYWMTQQTHGLFGNICDVDWSPIMHNLGLNVFTPFDQWDLSQTADPATIMVTVNGFNVPIDPNNGYTYEMTSNSVKFHGMAVPSAGATIDVSYSGLCRP
jgi:hypothetical protein